MSQGAIAGFCRVDLSWDCSLGVEAFARNGFRERPVHLSGTSVLYIHLRRKLQKRMHSAGRQLNGVYE